MVFYPSGNISARTPAVVQGAFASLWDADVLPVFAVRAHDTVAVTLLPVTPPLYLTSSL
jgi:hypothetical protein